VSNQEIWKFNEAQTLRSEKYPINKRLVGKADNDLDKNLASMSLIARRKALIVMAFAQSR